MKYLKTFENFTSTIPKAVAVEQEMTLMDKSIDKEITDQEKEELLEDEEEENESEKKKVA